MADQQSVRLSLLEQELRIEGYQQAIWDVFVETFEDLAEVLRVASMEASSSAPPARSMLSVLRARHHRLAVERKGIRELIEVTDLLYLTLRAEQRAHADRLLLPLCEELGFETVSASQTDQ